MALRTRLFHFFLPAFFSAAREAGDPWLLAETLLDTYLGHEAGRRVLNGSVKRGEDIFLPGLAHLFARQRFT